MCFGGGAPSIPKPPAPPSDTQAGISARREQLRRRRSSAGSGRESTLLTGALGVSNQSSAKKTLLGQ